MSYILDALRKSEKERQQDNLAPLEHISAPRPSNPSRKKGLSRVLLSGSIVLVAIIALGFLVNRLWISPSSTRHVTGNDSLPALSHSSGDTAADTTARLKMSQTDTVGQSPKKSAPDTASQAKREYRTNVSEPQKSQPAPLRQGQEKKDALVINRTTNHLPPMDLPLWVQEDIRNMTFAGHAYSPDPALRLIMINRRILHEGDAIDADLGLAEITENGVVLLYRAKRIRINLF